MLVGDLTCQWDILGTSGTRKMPLGHLKSYRDRYCNSDEIIYVQLGNINVSGISYMPVGTTGTRKMLLGHLKCYRDT